MTDVSLISVTNSRFRKTKIIGIFKNLGIRVRYVLMSNYFDLIVNLIRCVVITYVIEIVLRTNTILIVS